MIDSRRAVDKRGMGQNRLHIFLPLPASHKFAKSFEQLVIPENYSCRFRHATLTNHLPPPIAAHFSEHTQGKIEAESWFRALFCGRGIENVYCH